METFLLIMGAIALVDNSYAVKAQHIKLSY
jgi:hypothetical protein